MARRTLYPYRWKSFVDPEYWFWARDKALHFLRQYVKNPPSHATDSDIAAIKSEWVRKARRCHAIGMGRIPLASNFVVIDGGDARIGRLYVKKEGK